MKKWKCAGLLDGHYVVLLQEEDWTPLHSSALCKHSFQTGSRALNSSTVHKLNPPAVQYSIPYCTDAGLSIYVLYLAATAKDGALMEKYGSGAKYNILCINVCWAPQPLPEAQIPTSSSWGEFPEIVTVILNILYCTAALLYGTYGWGRVWTDVGEKLKELLCCICYEDWSFLTLIWLMICRQQSKVSIHKFNVSVVSFQLLCQYTPSLTWISWHSSLNMHQYPYMHDKKHKEYYNSRNRQWKEDIKIKGFYQFGYRMNSWDTAQPTQYVNGAFSRSVKVYSSCHLLHWLLDQGQSLS